MRKLFLIILVALIACGESNEIQQPATVVELDNTIRIDSGAIAGNQGDDGLLEFLGIPYAAPPIGDLRWQPPMAVAHWDAVLDATQRGLPCMQPKSASGFYGGSYPQTSEDCLTLNVWTRAKTASDGLPVMVWIHGGALLRGSAADYDGAGLTQKGVVLVTMNYRLGPFGFFAHPELSLEAPSGSSGNQGFLDQIAALKWVKENISAFGGDPNNVTVFGESAGSWSLSVIQASPMARGLFHKVIGQSGARFMPLPDLKQARWGLQSAEARGESVAQKITGQTATNLAAMRALDAQTIMQGYSSDPAMRDNFDYLTIQDGAVLPKEVNAIFAAAQQADVPVLIGSNANEATTFDPALSNPSLQDMDYGPLLTRQVEALLPAVGAQLLDFYPPAAADSRRSWTEFNTDVMFTQQMRLWADYMEAVSSPAYLYWWNWRPVINGSDRLGAFHAAEIPYVFGRLDAFGIEPSAEDYAFADLMMTIWTNFAKTGNPSVAEVIDWPAYRSSAPATAVLGPQLSIRQGIRSEQVALISAGFAARRTP